MSEFIGAGFFTSPNMDWMPLMVDIPVTSVPHKIARKSRSEVLVNWSHQSCQLDLTLGEGNSAVVGPTFRRLAWNFGGGADFHMLWAGNDVRWWGCKGVYSISYRRGEEARAKSRWPQDFSVSAGGPLWS